MGRRIDQALALLEAELADFEPERVSGDQAVELVQEYANGERLMTAGKALALRQVASTRSWQRAGAFSDVNSWLASVTHSTLGAASAAVQTAQRLESLSDTEAALREGALSAVQVEAIADAATVDPHAERRLLQAASRDGVAGLKRECGACEGHRVRRRRRARRADPRRPVAALLDRP
jgi:hypothetical protein